MNEFIYSKESGFCYHPDTMPEVISIIDDLYQNRKRVVLEYGDIESGTNWYQSYGISGKIGKTTGERPIPILLHNRNSMGGPAILTHCIIGIKESKGKRVLYRLKG